MNEREVEPQAARDALREAAMAIDPFPPEGSPSDMATAWLVVNLPRLAALRAALAHTESATDGSGADD